MSEWTMFDSPHVGKHANLTGAAGEYFVAYKLSAMGYIVGIPRAGSPGVDLIVTHPTIRRTVTIQVKTSTYALRELKREKRHRWEWPVSGKCANNFADSFFYVFVDLSHFSGAGGYPAPKCFIVESSIVARYEGLMWSMPQFRIEMEDSSDFLEEWDKLKIALGDRNE